MTTPSQPSYMPFLAPGMDTQDLLQVLQQQQTNAMISGGVEKVIDTIGRDTRFLNQNIVDGTARTVGAIETHSLGLRDAIERNGTGLSNAVERTSAATQSAIERIAGEGRLTTVTTDAATRQAAADANRDIQVSIERTAANNYNAIERNSLESRLAGAVGEAALRQASADQARDILGSIERNAGEGRLTTVQTDAETRQIITDARRDMTDVTVRGTNELLNAINLSANENRLSGLTSSAELKEQLVNSFSKIDNQYANTLLEMHRTSDRNAFQNARDHAQILLEGQKQTSQLGNEVASLSKQASDHYASLIIEGNRNKEMLAAQAANNFAVSQLETQKLKESIMMQLADAKYEGLKNKESLAAQLADHNSDIKSTVRALDENRVRDALNVSSNEVNLLKYLAPLHHHHHRDRSRSPSRHYNITNVFEDDDRFYRGRGRGGRGGRGDDRSDDEGSVRGRR